MFPQQQWLHERASMSRYTYIACLVCMWHNHSDPLSFTKSASSSLALLVFTRYFFQFLVGQISLFIHLLSDYLIFCCCYFHLYLINSTTVSFSLAFVIHLLSDHPISYSAVICILYLINSATVSFSLAFVIHQLS